VIDNTSVNLLSAEGHELLHVSVRRAENQLCFNARMANSAWGKEERVPLYGVFQQTDTTISVRIDKDAYVVLIDGKIRHTFTKRIDKEVKGVIYRCDNTSVFANPINVSVVLPGAPKPPLTVPASSYQEKYFPLTAAGVAVDSEAEPFDYVIIGSGIGGGILAADLHDKNKRMMTSHSDFGANSTSNEASMWNRSMQLAVGKDDRTKRILVIERGNLLFNTHSLNMPRPTSRGGKGQMNDVFFHDFKHEWDMDQATRDIWEGGAVYCLGGRSSVWGLFCPRYGAHLILAIMPTEPHYSISDDTLRTKFHPDVYKDLNASYLRRAEEYMNVTYPKTLPLHRELMDRLNIHTKPSLPTTQWMWGRIASEFTDQKNRNFDFAEGAFSSIDRLVEAAMDDKGNGQFKTLLDSSVMRLEPKPESGKQKPVTHVVVKDASGTEHKIRTKNAVVCAGTVDSAAILLRSMGDGVTPTQAYGEAFAANFGQATDHYIFAVSLSFYYRNMEYKDVLGGMKLMTDITFQHIDRTTALANISLDASSFLPRRNVPDSELPQFILAYILPTELRRSNKVSLNAKGEPYLSIDFPEDDYIDDRKQVMLDFAVDVMNKFADTLDLQFVQNRDAPTDPYVPLARVTKDNIKLKRVGPGAVAHELGSIPMASKTRDGLLDENLKMRHGWDNVHVCDLSVFPYSPAANPTLSLAALALRLSDKLVPPAETRYQPIVVYNMTPEAVWVHMTNSNTDMKSFNPPDSDAAGAKIEPGGSATWMREQRESIFVFASEGADNFDVQIVKPGMNTLIASPPPKGSANPSQRLTVSVHRFLVDYIAHTITDPPWSGLIECTCIVLSLLYEHVCTESLR
jgi:hypothetical protein